MPTNEHGDPHPEGLVPPSPGMESAKDGYETTDVNVKHVIVFLGGLFGFVLVFFVFCFYMGKVINLALDKRDGPVDKWHTRSSFAGSETKGQLDNLTSNAEMQKRAFDQMNAFPNPRLDIDDGNQATADLHAKEDLLLDHYSTVPGEPGIRIPIDRAMELIAAKGLPVQTPATTGKQLAYDATPVVQAPLTTGFARTGFELEVMEARAQQLDYGKAEHASAEPHK